MLFHLILKTTLWSRCHYYWASLLAEKVKNAPAMRETWVRSLGWKDPLEKKMATHSSMLVWEIPRTEGLVGYSPWGHRESDMTERLSLFTIIIAILQIKKMRHGMDCLSHREWVFPSKWGNSNAWKVLHATDSQTPQIQHVQQEGQSVRRRNCERRQIREEKCVLLLPLKTGEGAMHLRT